jgi:signal transduction histidine kinase/HPt (histidine-containing phosphotransfer) domain-containing protein/ActR/RegA family two-component response regulator
MRLARHAAVSALLWISSRGAAALPAGAPGWQLGTAGVPPMRVFTARDTGVATMAWSAAQDASGTLYFGCDTVVSFDGDRWRQERMDPTYLVRGLDVGPNGRIWAAGVNQIGWFAPAPRGGLEYHSLMPQLPQGDRELGDVWRVYAEGDDSAVFVARERILRWDGTRMSSWAYPGMHLLWSTRTARSVYVHYPPLGLLRIGPAGPSVAVPASLIGPAEVRWLDDSGEDWLLLTSQGFKRLRAGACTPLDTEASAFARANTPTSVARLGDGSLAIGTLQGGIAVVDRAGSVRRVYDIRSGLPANQVYSLFVDRDGALWGMGPTNIVRLAVRSGAAVYGQRSGYPPGGCDTLTEYSGSVLAISHSGIFRLSADPQSGGAGQFEALGATSSRFYSLLSMPQGLVIAHVRGLGLWSPGGMTPVPRLEDSVFRLSPSQSRPGRVLASLHDRVLSVDPLTGDSDVVAESLPDYGDTLAEEPSGRLWIGTPSSGLVVAGPGSARAEPARNRFGPLPAAGPVLVTRAGPVIVAVAKGAAYYLDPATDRFRRVSGFPAGEPIAVSNSDSRGGVWAALDPDTGGHSPRLGRISVSGDGATWAPQSVEGLSGVGSLLGLRVVSLPERDDLWIAGTESLLCAGPAALAPHPPPRRPAIRAWVMAEGGTTSGGIAGTLPYLTRGLHIEYSSLDYGMRESERFQTMLGGAETEWSPPTDSADRDVSGLREGSYDFRVRLVTDSGEVGEAALLHFDIAPPWWQTPLARAVFATAGALAVLGFLRLRTRSLKRRAQVLERMVRQRTEELQKANAAKTEFVASMSHEIRNPMGGILASALELSETPLEPAQQRLVTTIRTCGTFLASLVEDVLDFAEIEAGAYKVEPSPFSPRDVLENVVKMLEPRAATARMDASVDPALPGLIVGDAARIQQVIVNFAANSLKFGGRYVALSARADGGHVVFTVTDDGVGIPAEEQKNLFIRFSRLKSARNSAIPGTGLGLAVSRVLAERMGGSVGFSTEPGRGSAFFLRLPLEAGALVPPGARPFDARGAKALVVEDIGYNARALGLMLGRLGFEVEFATDGHEALASLGSSSYGAVFIDCDLPGVSGTEVARRFRASEAPGRRTLIVATTALSTVEDRNTCIASGMDAFITKPITPEKLRAVLSDGGEPGPGPAGSPPDPGAQGAPGLRLDLLVHLAGGSPAALARELASFASSLDEAVRGVEAARASGPRTAVSSAAHRVLSLSRMVGAEALSASAADIQDYAAAYTEAELDEEIAALCRHAGELALALPRARAGLPLNPSLAS